MDKAGKDAAIFAPYNLMWRGWGTGNNAHTVTIEAPLWEPLIPEHSRNLGLRKRHRAVADSVRKVLIDRLHIDLFQQVKFIPNGVDLRLRFNRANLLFYMMTAAGSSGQVVILNMLLWVRKVKPNPKVLNAINQRLNSETAKYPLRPVKVKTFTIPAGTHLRSVIISFKDKCPKRVVLVYMENAAFNRDNLKNPFHFKNERVKKLEVSINGETISTRPYEPDFQRGLYLRSSWTGQNGRGLGFRHYPGRI